MDHCIKFVSEHLALDKSFLPFSPCNLPQVHNEPTFSYPFGKPKKTTMNLQSPPSPWIPIFGERFACDRIFMSFAEQAQCSFWPPDCKLQKQFPTILRHPGRWRTLYIPSLFWEALKVHNESIQISSLPHYDDSTWPFTRPVILHPSDGEDSHDAELECFPHCDPLASRTSLSVGVGTQNRGTATKYGSKLTSVG